MYTWVASLKAADGKGRESVACLKEACAYLNQHCPPAQPWTVAREVFGEHGTLIVIAGFNSLADIERIRAWSATDEGYAAILKKFAGLFVAGSRRDWVLESV